MPPEFTPSIQGKPYMAMILLDPILLLSIHSLILRLVCQHAGTDTPSTFNGHSCLFILVSKSRNATPLIIFMQFHKSCLRWWMLIYYTWMSRCLQHGYIHSMIDRDYILSDWLLQTVGSSFIVSLVAIGLYGFFVTTAHKLSSAVYLTNAKCNPLWCQYSRWGKLVFCPKFYYQCDYFRLC